MRCPLDRSQSLFYFVSHSQAGSTNVPPFPVKKFLLTFQENLVRGGPRGVPGRGGIPLMESFRDWGY